MKNSVKILLLVVSLFTFNSTLLALSGVEMLKKEKPKPVYSVDLDNKKITFESVDGSYIIDNDQKDIVMEGQLEGAGHAIDISSLSEGTYLLEIEHRGYIHTELIVID